MTARARRTTTLAGPNRLVLGVATGGLVALASAGTALLVLTGTSSVAPIAAPAPPLPTSPPMARPPGVVVLPSDEAGRLAGSPPGHARPARHTPVGIQLPVAAPQAPAVIALPAILPPVVVTPPSATPAVQPTPLSAPASPTPAVLPALSRSPEPTVTGPGPQPTPDVATPEAAKHAAKDAGKHAGKHAGKRSHDNRGRHLGWSNFAHDEGR